MMTSVTCPACLADVGSVPAGPVGDIAAQVLIGIHATARHGSMRVVCVACFEHYADVDPATPPAQLLAHSEELGFWHAPRCTATREQHQAGLEMVQAIEALQT